MIYVQLRKHVVVGCTNTQRSWRIRWWRAPAGATRCFLP